MRKACAAALISCLVVLCSCSLIPQVTQVPLKTVPSRVGMVYPARPIGVTVAVDDARPDRAVLGGETTPGLPDRVMRLFAEDKAGNVADAFKAAAADATQAMGFGAGTDVRLELSIQKFYVDMYWASLFTTVNCIGYGEIQSTLKSRDGAVLRSRKSWVVYWEDTRAAGGFEQITQQAISRIYAQAAWETTVKILQEQFVSDAAPTLQDALRLAQGKGPEMDRREAIFWLGLFGRNDPAVENALLRIFRASGYEEQNLAEGAAEAIGMLGLKSSRGEFESVLSGSRKLPEWDFDDTECVWYLLKALYLLGVPDLEARIPPKIKMRGKLIDLVQFLEQSTFPQLSPKQLQDIENGKLKLKTQ